MTPEDIRRVCEDHGVKQFAGALEANLEPYLRIEVVRDDRPAVGAHRIGGAPDLPAEAEWPTFKGKSLAFVAQFNLSELGRWKLCDSLPSQGMLYFFYSVDAGTWGFDPADRGSWRVLYSPGVTVEPRALPDDLSDESRFESCGASLAEDMVLGTIPDYLQDGSDDALWEVLDDLAEARATSQLLGPPLEIQGEMRDQCALVSEGLYCGDSTGYSDPRAEAILATSQDWHLLLQLGSEDDAGMMWGDVGCLYFWIRTQDLAEHRFDRTWMILQCG